MPTGESDDAELTGIRPKTVTEYFVLSERVSGSDWAEGDHLTLEHDPDQRDDVNALVAVTVGGTEIGHLWREDAEELAPRVNQEAPYEAWIDRILTGSPDKPYCGVVIEVRFADDPPDHIPRRQEPGPGLLTRLARMLPRRRPSRGSEA
ncbi:MAG: HIRAN domain-containing protein [Chloroflexi bacterium]|nr:HIRAN domain-containing protein [Chloroflexota bacterium]